MSRWDSLRPERRRECATTIRNKPRPAAAPAAARRELSTTTRPRTQTESLQSVSSLDQWNVKLVQLKVALQEEREHDIQNAIDRLEAILESGSYIPSKESAGEALLMALTACESRRGVAEDRRLELASRILAKVKLSLTNRQVKECVSSLISSGGGNSKRVDCLARLVLVKWKQMPAEETAKTVLGMSLLPVLEDPNEHVSIVIRAIQCLLSDPLHASAMLAPLTLDITESGQEEIMTNPLRSRLLRAMQGLLKYELYSREACQSLIRLIKAINPATVGDANEIDPSLLKPFILESLGSGGGRKGDVCELLRLVLKTYPATSTALSSLFIRDRCAPLQNSALTACSHCTYRTGSPLLDSLHDDAVDGRESIVPCLQGMLQSLPLHLWLANCRSTSGMQQFGDRACEALIQLIRVAKCRFRRCPLSIPPLCPLIRDILTRIPFSDDESDLLTCEAITLLSLVSRSFTRRPCSELVDCLVVGMGGHPRPEGGTTLMSIPMKLWLCSFRSLDFREYLWTCVQSKTAEREVCMQILCAMIRSLPSITLSNEATWDRYQRVVLAHTIDSSHRIRLGGTSLLEMALTGRAECDGQVGNGREIAVFASSVAGTMLEDKTPQVRVAAVHCYGAFVPEDWRILLEDNAKVPFSRQIGKILSHCVSPSEGNATVRSAACKAIGNICTQCLAKPTEQQEESSFIRNKEKISFCRDVCEAMSKSLQDSNVGVRSMTVFALGNLAHVFREIESKELLIPPHYMRQFCESVLTCLGESNSKVVGNAIRTGGLLVSLVFHPPYVDSRAVDGWETHAFYRDALCALNQKVEAALASERRQEVTWKQRSTTNKQAWGACHSLALVLDCDEAASEVNVRHSQESLALLVQCVDDVDAVHEKVAIAAIGAFRKISDTMLIRISEGSGIIGTALAPCLVKLYQTRKRHDRKNMKLTQELSLLLTHLLRATTIADACILLKNCDVDKSVMEFLYDWMVNEKLPLVSFESFAISLQRREIMDNASLQQMFASRALQLSRSAGEQALSDALQDSINNDATIEDVVNDEL